MPLTARGLLVLLLVCLSAAHVSSQKVEVKQVSTTFLVVSWEKADQWQGVNSFQVNIKMNGYEFCDVSLLCFLPTTCTFNSHSKCGKFSPCADVSVTVSGGGYTAPKEDRISAPPPVTDIKVKGPANMKTITWTNPTSNTCLQAITAAVVYGGYYDYSPLLNKNETSLTVPLCMRGLGSVKVRTKGGNGTSDASSVTLTRVVGDDAVKITDCPPEGCTDVVINWKYKAVCPDVDHLYLTMGTDFSPITNLTTNLTTTTASFTHLDLNTKYDICLHANDKDDKLLARHCTKCGSQPEVADQLTVTNVTDTTARIDWEPPICPTADEFQYKVSYSTKGTVVEVATTTNTNYLWTFLNPAVDYSLCVTVLHKGVPSADSMCVDTFTLPAAPEEIVVRVYEETSLFITWPAELYTPNLKYHVSWGDDLTHTDYTEYKSYTIDGYNTTAGPDVVCVEVETKNPVGLRSRMTCRESPFPNFTPAKPDHTHMIIGVSVSAGLAVALSLVLVVVAKKQERPSSNL